MAKLFRATVVTSLPCRATQTSRTTVAPTAGLDVVASNQMPLFFKMKEEMMTTPTRMTRFLNSMVRSTFLRRSLTRMNFLISSKVTQMTMSSMISTILTSTLLQLMSTTTPRTPPTSSPIFPPLFTSRLRSSASRTGMPLTCASETTRAA